MTVISDLDSPSEKTTYATEWDELASHIFALNKGEDGKYFVIGSCEYQVDKANNSGAVRILINGNQKAIDVHDFNLANAPHTFTFFGLATLPQATYIISLEAKTAMSNVALKVKNIKLLIVKF